MGKLVQNIYEHAIQVHGGWYTKPFSLGKLGTWLPCAAKIFFEFCHRKYFLLLGEQILFSHQFLKVGKQGNSDRSSKKCFLL